MKYFVPYSSFPSSKIYLLAFSIASLINPLNCFGAIAQTPLPVITSVDPNVLLNMSIETPMGGAAYNDQADIASGCVGHQADSGDSVGVCYNPARTFIGYFDPKKCYSYDSANSRFTPDSAAINHSCTGQFSGNFLNWATMTAMDEFVWTMTGGNRIIDQASDSATLTVIRKVRTTGGYFPKKLITSTYNVAPSTVTPWTESKIYISPTDYGVNFGTTLGGSEKGLFEISLVACDKNTGLETNCIAYNNGRYYKPQGLIQKHADHMRFATTSYSGLVQDGGVLRSNMKYVGTLMPDGSGGMQDNPNKEIAADGTLILNPNPADATASGVTLSGVIPYINRFSDNGYKSIDPAAELFYESIRYFKKKGPTPEYLTGANGGFPILNGDRWQDPIQFYCQKNFIVGINDANPWLDKKLPGSFFTSRYAPGTNVDLEANCATTTCNDYGQPSNADTDINVTTLTNRVGDLQGITNTAQAVGCTSAQCNWDTTPKTITGLGEVAGTFPYPNKRNSYYIAGLAYYANTQDLRSDLQGKQSIKTFMIDTQEYSSTPLTGQMNMLWLAGKYGGFNDLNGNGIPDGPDANLLTPSEWDKDNDNTPDNYVLASNPEKLVKGLNDTFNNIEANRSAGTAPAANSGQISSESLIYLATYNPQFWSGEITAYAIDNLGALTQKWQASTGIPAPSSRRIYTFDPNTTDNDPNGSNGHKGLAFEWTNLTSEQQTALNTMSFIVDSFGADRVAWIRGDHSKEQKQNGIFRNRNSVLGDIVNSSPIYVHHADQGYANLPDPMGSAYRTFLTTHRRPMLYAGANDGMLHGFDASNSTAGSTEIFAYIPNALFPNLSELSSPNYTHRFFVDGQTSTSDVYFNNQWHTWLVGSTGAGGRIAFGLDITNPDNFNDTSPLWEFSHKDDPDLGYTLSKPLIVRAKNGQWLVLLTNGYESDRGHAVLFVLDAHSGQLLKKLDTGDAFAGTTAKKNGLSSPVAYDKNNDLAIDTVYAGDLYGNLWRFDLSSADINDWSAPDKPLFVACVTANDNCPDADRQPITVQPAVGPVSRSDANQAGKGVMVYFGTGKYFEIGDNIVGPDPQVQSYYGIWDKNGESTINNRNQLQQQSVLAKGMLRVKSGTGNTIVTVISKNPVCYASSSPGNCSQGSPKMGWVLNLTEANAVAVGERAYGNPLLYKNRLIFTTAIPKADPCQYGGNSQVMILDPLSGGEAGNQPIDTNGDGQINDDDKVGLSVNGVDTYGAASGFNIGQGLYKGVSILSNVGGKSTVQANCSENGGNCNEQILIPEGGKQKSWRVLR